MRLANPTRSGSVGADLGFAAARMEQAGEAEWAPGQWEPNQIEVAAAMRDAGCKPRGLAMVIVCAIVAYRDALKGAAR